MSRLRKGSEEGKGTGSFSEGLQNSVDIDPDVLEVTGQLRGRDDGETDLRLLTREWWIMYIIVSFAWSKSTRVRYV